MKNGKWSRAAAMAVAIGVLSLGQAGARTTSSIQSTAGMVVTSQRYASDVGAAVLRRGGNAIDAAMAVGCAVAVVHPCCGNIGGGGFMVIHPAKGCGRARPAPLTC